MLASNVCKLFNATGARKQHQGDCLTGSSTHPSPPPAVVLPTLVDNEYGPYCDEKDEQRSLEYDTVSPRYTDFLLVRSQTDNSFQIRGIDSLWSVRLVIVAMCPY